MPRTAVLFAFVLCLTTLSPASRVTAEEPAPIPEPKPDATIQITVKSLAIGVGYSWGEGTLEFQGQGHTVTMEGLLVLGLGFSAADAKGQVYYLNDLDDFPGRYEPPRGASSLGEGGAGVVMANEKGVEVRMVAENTGVLLSLGDSPVKLALER